MPEATSSHGLLFLLSFPLPLSQRLAQAVACWLLFLVTLQPADTICLVFCLNASLFLKAAERGMVQGCIPPAQAEMGSPVWCNGPFFLLHEGK